MRHDDVTRRSPCTGRQGASPEVVSPSSAARAIERRLSDSDAGAIVVAVPGCDPRWYPTSANLIGRPATIWDDDLENQTHVRTVSYGRRRFVSDYGSEGWGFESLRARHIDPVQSRSREAGFLVHGRGVTPV
jgi:hypothetical protein